MIRLVASPDPAIWRATGARVAADADTVQARLHWLGRTRLVSDEDAADQLSGIRQASERIVRLLAAAQQAGPEALHAFRAGLAEPGPDID